MGLTLTPIKAAEIPNTKNPSAHAREMGKIVSDFAGGSSEAVKIELNGDGPSARSVVLGLNRAIKNGNLETLFEAVNIGGVVYLRRK